MGKFFNIESPLWQSLSRIADVLILNVLFLITCVPVVTVGAAAAGLYTAMQKLVVDEGSVWRDFWHGFKSNFKQATAIWLILLVTGVVIFISMLYYIGVGSQGKTWLLALAMIPVILWGGVYSWVFPLQARFYNPVKATLRNAVLCGVGYFPRTLAMVVLNLLPAALFLVRLDLFVTYGIFLFVGYYGLVAYLSCRMLQKPFQKFIDQIENQEEALETT